MFGVHGDDLPKAAARFFKEWKEQRKLIEQLESEIVRLRTSGGGDATSDVDGVRVVVMEIDGDLKSMTTMLKELTLDASAPTLAVLGSRDGGGKLMIAATENTLASERYNAVDLLRSISPHIKGGAAVAPRLHKAVGLTPMAWTMRSMLLEKRWASDHNRLRIASRSKCETACLNASSGWNHAAAEISSVWSAS